MIRRFLINRNYARLWYGEAASTIGDFVFDTTLVLWVATVLGKGQRWAPVAVSGVLLSAGVAILLVGPLAGVFVDRWNRKRTMLRTEVVRAVLVAALTLVFLVPVRDLPDWAWLTMIYLVVFVINASGQFFSPARLAILAEIVEGDADRARAAGIGQATYASAAIIGPPLAAPLLFSVGVQWALAANALSYVVSYAAVRSIRVAPAVAAAEAAQDAATVAAEGRAADTGAAAVRGLRAEFTAGLRYFTGSRFLVALTTVAAVVALGSGAINTLNVFFVTRNLHAAPRLYGFMSMAFGIGAILGSLLAGTAVRLIGPRRLTCFGLLLVGALVFAYAQQRDFVAGVTLLALFSVPVAMLNAGMTPLLLGAVPPQYLGRMMAVFNPVLQLASMLSVVVAGWLASTVLPHVSASFLGLRFGPISTVFAAAGILVILAGAYAFIAFPPEARPAPADGPADAAEAVAPAQAATPAPAAASRHARSGRHARSRPPRPLRPGSRSRPLIPPRPGRPDDDASPGPRAARRRRRCSPATTPRCSASTLATPWWPARWTRAGTWPGRSSPARISRGCSRRDAGTA